MWTETDIEKIDRAIASGTLRVRFADKEVEYHSMDELLRAREIILRAVKGPQKPHRFIAYYDKGL